MAPAAVGSAPPSKLDEQIEKVKQMLAAAGVATDQQPPTLTIRRKKTKKAKQADPVPELEQIEDVLKIPVREVTADVRDRLVTLIQLKIYDADTGYFAAGDGINYLRNVPRPGADRAMYSVRDIAKLLGFWEASFISKLGTVSRDCDAEARAFALDNRIRWQTCYNICADRRRLKSDKPVIEFFKEYVANHEREAEKEGPDSTEVALKKMADDRKEGQYKRSVALYALRLYRAAKRWLEFQTKTERMSLAWQVVMEGRKDAAVKIRNDATMMSRSLGTDDQLAEADFNTIVEFIKRADPEAELDIFDLEGEVAIAKKYNRDERPLVF
jgi:hypothetical protein